MNIFYIVFVSFLSIFFLFRRKLDLFAVWFAALLALSPPYVLGVIYIPPLIVVPEVVDVKSYVMMAFLLSAVFLFSVVFDCRVRDKQSKKIHGVGTQRIKLLSFLMVFFSLFLFIVLVVFVGTKALAGFRSGVSLNTIESGLLSKALLFSTYAVVFGAASNCKASYMSGFIVLMLLYSVSPSRSFLFVALVSFVMVSFVPKGRVSYFNFLKYLPLFLLIVFFVVFGKVLRHEDGSFITVISNYVERTLSGSVVGFREANYIAANLQASVLNIQPGEMLERVYYYPLMLVPFLYLVLENAFGLSALERFSSIVLNLHNFDDFGVASSFWGEVYSVGGWVAVTFFVLMLGVFVFFVNNRFLKGDGKVFSLSMLVPAVYTVAYSHRMDVSLLLNRFSEAFLVFVICVLFLKLRKL